MTTQELRIGNLVNTPNPNMNPFKIEHIEAVGIDKVGGSNGIGSFVYWSFSDIEPIKLTEEWLVKFGFLTYKSHEFHLSIDLIKYPSGYESDELNFVIDMGTESLRIEQTSIDAEHEGHFLGKLYPAFPKYVHQLQNLYFVLTGEELP